MCPRRQFGRFEFILYPLKSGVKPIFLLFPLSFGPNSSFGPQPILTSDASNQFKLTNIAQNIVSLIPEKAFRISCTNKACQSNIIQ